MQCEQFETGLPLLALDELDAERKAAVEAHLAGCPACRAKLADLLATLGLLTEAARRLPETKLPAARRQALPTLASRPAARPLRMGLLVRVAAAVLLCVACAGLLLPALSRAREEARRKGSESNLSQTVIADLSRHEANGDFFRQFAKSPSNEPDKTTYAYGGYAESKDTWAFGSLLSTYARQSGTAAEMQTSGGSGGGGAGRLRMPVASAGEAVSSPPPTQSVRGEPIVVTAPAAPAPPEAREKVKGEKAVEAQEKGAMAPFTEHLSVTGAPIENAKRLTEAEHLESGEMLRRFKSLGFTAGAGPVPNDVQSTSLSNAIAARLVPRAAEGAPLAAEAQKALKEQRASMALEEAENATRQEREREERRKLALFSEANAEFAKEKYQSAVNLAERVLELDPENGAARGLIDNAREVLRRRTWDSITEQDKKSIEDERVRLRLKAVFPAATVQYPAKEIFDEIKARPPVNQPSAPASQSPAEGQTVLYLDDGAKQQEANSSINESIENTHAEAGKGGGGQNVRYFDGHVKWSESAKPITAPIDNTLAERGAVAAAKTELAAPKAPVEEAASAPVVRGGPVNHIIILADGGGAVAAPKTEPAAPKPPAEEAASAPVFKAGPVNPWVMTDKDALSTFAVDVDMASYAIARNYIGRGSLPPPASVRMEEYVNAFDYNYPTQSRGVFSVLAEAGPSPFRPGLTLLKIGVRARVAGRETRKPAHFVFVVDASGSMERPDRLPLVRVALKTLLDRLDPQDRVSLVTFATRPTLVLESAPISEKARIQAAVDGLRCGGATNLYDGLKLGYETAARAFRPGATNRVILCTDGVANIGLTAADEMLKGVEEFRRQGVTLTVMGCGYGAYDDSLLERLAEHGDGNYSFMADEAEAQRVFSEEMSAALQPVALDAKIQVAFDPARVRRFRLIGFENRILAAADFRNDAVIAGAVGSGQSSTALYELELLPQAEGEDSAGDLGTVFVRYRDIETGRVEEISSRLASDIVRKRTAADSPRFLLAACAAEFAELLRGSEHARNGSFGQVRSVLEPVVMELPLDARVRELLTLVQRAEGLPRAQ